MMHMIAGAIVAFLSQAVIAWLNQIFRPPRG